MRLLLLVPLILLSGCIDRDHLTNEQKIKLIQACEAAGLRAAVREYEVDCYQPWR